MWGSRAAARLRCLRGRVVSSTGRRDAEYPEDRTGRGAEGADRRLHGAAAHRVPRPHGVRDHRAPEVPARRRCPVRRHQEHIDAARPRADRRGRARVLVRRSQCGCLRARGSGRRREERDGRSQEVPGPRAQGRVRGRASALRGRGEVTRRPRIPRGDAVQARRLDEGRDVARRRGVPGDAGSFPLAPGSVQGEAPRGAGRRGGSHRGARGGTRDRGARGKDRGERRRTGRRDPGRRTRRRTTGQTKDQKKKGRSEPWRNRRSEQRTCWSSSRR